MTPDLQDVARSMGLTEAEYQEILRRLGRTPNRVELGVFALNWSEHCSYKTSRRFLRRFPQKSDRTVLGPGENAGVLRLNARYGVAFKIESHNHPSAVEPYHGAATGVGGILRDVLAVGAWPLALLDSLRFGPPQEKRSAFLAKGVVAGISGYGNATGVPTVAGEIVYDAAYRENPLVNAMCVGVVPLERVQQAILKGPGNLLLLFGNTTARDGIHGATFASENLDEDTASRRPNVQIGDPFYEKLLIEVVQEILELPGLIGLQDLGAGGLSTAPLEMAEKGGVGVELWLDRVPLRMELTPEEVLLSESQERMVVCVERGKEEAFLEVFRRWHLPHAVIGQVLEEPVFRAQWKGEIVAEIPLQAVMEVPERRYPLVEAPRATRDHPPDAPLTSLGEALQRLLDHEPSLRSQRWAYEQYDHTVQGNTVVDPGEADAAVVRVRWNGKHPAQEVLDLWLALTVDGNGRKVALDPYEGGKRVVAEAARNLVSVGADPIGITNCLNFASPEVPEVYAQLDAVTRGMAEAAEALGLPIVSGNVSLYNESPTSRIHPTPVIGMVGVIEDGRIVRPDALEPGHELLMVGRSEGAVGGSAYLRVWFGDDGYRVDPVDLALEVRLLGAIRELQRKSWISVSHDVSEGGLLMALVDLALWSNTGMELTADARTLCFWLGEWEHRFVVGVPPQHSQRVFRYLEDQDLAVRPVARAVAYPSIVWGEERVALAQILVWRDREPWEEGI